MAHKAFAVIAGVGPGTGAAISRRFASAYPVALLGRSPSKFDWLVQEINDGGGKAIAVKTDVSNETSVKEAFGKIHDEFQDATCAAAIFNASGPLGNAPLLELGVSEFSAVWEVTWYDKIRLL